MKVHSVALTPSHKGLAVPALSEQHRIVKSLGSLQPQAEWLEQLQSETQKEIDDLKKSILDEAFRGEL